MHVLGLEGHMSQVSGPEVLFKTCVAMKFVDDDDDDDMHDTNTSPKTNCATTIEENIYISIILLILRYYQLDSNRLYSIWFMWR